MAITMEATTLTKSDLSGVQRRVLNDVIDYATMSGFYEVKELELEDCYGDVSVRLVTGMPNDKGTMAYYLCRDTYIFWIGKKGGVYQYKEGRNGYYRVYRKGGIVSRTEY